MNLHEYQGKILLRKFGVKVPEGILATTTEEADKAAHSLYESTHTDRFAVKAQIHAGGRGKGGGVKIEKSFEEVNEHA